MVLAIVLGNSTGKVFLMYKNTAIATGVVTLLLAAAPAEAITITYGHGHDAQGVPTSSVAGARVNNFNDSSFTNWIGGPNPVTGTTTSGGGSHFVTGDVSNRYAAPYISDGPNAGTDDTTVYLSVPSSSNSGSVTLLLNAGFDYFGLLWGSIDTYNSIAFLLGGSPVASFTGSDVTNPNAANGNQTAPSTNTYVNFFDLPTFNAVKFGSTNYAFELDNIALATLSCTANCGGSNTSVSEPAGIGLVGIGLLGLGLATRRRKLA